MAKATCYMCTELKTSVEHVPPRGLFPKAKDLPQDMNMRKQLITVPACDRHNSEKSTDDEYLMYVLLFGIQNNHIASLQVKTKITRALKENASVAKLIAQQHQSVVFEDVTTGEVGNTVALKIDTARFYSSLDHIGRAIHFHHYGTKWTGAIQVIPLFLLELGGKTPAVSNDRVCLMGEYVENLLLNEQSHGANPEVFAYKLMQLEDNLLRIVMQLTFYEGSRVVLLFKQ